MTLALKDADDRTEVKAARLQHVFVIIARTTATGVHQHGHSTNRGFIRCPINPAVTLSVPSTSSPPSQSTTFRLTSCASL